MKKTRRTWSVDQKAQIAAEARRRRKEGETFPTICAALGVLQGSLRLWMDQYPGGEALQPVQIIESAPPLPAEEPDDLITVIAPDGFRFETMTVGSALRIWEAIRCSA